MPSRRKRLSTAIVDSTYEGKKRRFHENVAHDSALFHLPIKDADGRIVFQTREPTTVANGTAVDSEIMYKKEPEEVVAESSSAVPLTTVELFAARKRALVECRSSIAELSRAILSDPEHEIGRLKDLMAIASHSTSPLVKVSGQKLATASLLEVFLHIIPGFRIAEPKDTDRHHLLKKETRQLRSYEQCLLTNYKKYLQHLEHLITSEFGFVRSRKRNTQHRAMTKSSCSGLSLGKLALTCICKLLIFHPHFNFSSNIVRVVVALSSHNNAEVSEQCCLTIEQLFREDKSGDISYDVVRTLKERFKNDSTRLKARSLQTLLALPIREVQNRDTSAQKHQGDQDSMKRRLAHISKKEKQRRKKLGGDTKLDKDLAELESTSNQAKRLELNTKIMNLVFTMYFLVLKEFDRPTLLPPVLEGLSKFADLINVELFDDLIGSLYTIASEKASVLNSLHCAQATFKLLTGEGEALTVDPSRFHRLVYGLLPKVVAERNSVMQIKQFRLCLECFDYMLIRRRKMVSQTCAAAFVKRLAVLGSSMTDSMLVASLAAMRMICVAHPGLETMLDFDATESSVYSPHVDEPEHCGALGSALTELKIFAGHAIPEVRTLANHMLRNLPAQGTGQLPPHLLAMSPVQLFEAQLQIST